MTPFDGLTELRTELQCAAKTCAKDSCRESVLLLPRRQCGWHYFLRVCTGRLPAGSTRSALPKGEVAVVKTGNRKLCAPAEIEGQAPSFGRTGTTCSATMCNFIVKAIPSRTARLPVTLLAQTSLIGLF